MKSVKGTIHTMNEPDASLVAVSGKVMKAVDAVVSGALLVTELQIEVYHAVSVAVLELEEV